MTLNEHELRVVRRKARIGTLSAIDAVGGRGKARRITTRAKRDGGFTRRELAAPAPENAADRYRGRVDYEIAWTLTLLERDGVLANPEPAVWALVGTHTEADGGNPPECHGGRRHRAPKALLRRIISR